MKLNSELNFSNLVAKIFLKPREKISQTSRHVTQRHRLGVRIADSHSVDTGSNPVTANFSVKKICLCFREENHQTKFGHGSSET